MKHIIVPFLFSLATCSSALSGTGYTLTLLISGYTDSQIYLASLRGDAYRIIDTAKSENNVFTFTLSDKSNTGVYRIISASSPAPNRRNAPMNNLDLIFNHENITLRTVYPWLQDSLVVLESGENRIYFDFLAGEAELQKKMDLLQNLLMQYPREDEFFQEVVNRYNALQEERTGLIEQTAKAHPGSFASALIAFRKTPVLDAGLPEQERQAYLKTHYFDGLDFSNPDLIASNAYTHSVVRYIMLFRDPKLSPPELEKEFTRAVDVIISHAGSNPEVYNFILNYLMEGFEQLKLENVLKYIADNYLTTVCQTDNSSTLQRRMQWFSKMALGQTSPDISITDALKKEIKLSSITKPYTLVVFWASWCPTCEELLPKLETWYKSKIMDMEILAISIDTVSTDWKNAIAKNSYTFLHGCDLKGWNGKAAEDLCIYATPTMIILDRNRKIIAKPLSFEDFSKTAGTLVK